MTETTAQWIRRHAHPFTTLDPQASLADLLPLRDMARDATVVALGASTREAHELSAIARRILRLLVEELGFRSIALEGDDAGRLKLDEYVRTGQGDPRALLADARPFWQTEEILGVIRWMRARNERHPGDPVRFAGGRPRQATPRPDGLEAVERRLAEDMIWWHERTGEKIVYWGGIAHTVNGVPRTVSPSSPPATHRNAGSHLRERFGPRYLSLGLTFHHGVLRCPVPAPPADFAEVPLGAGGPDAFYLDLRAESSEPVRAWLAAPARTRLIGPAYDPGDDAAYHLSGGSLIDWFDVVAHCRKVTPVHLIPR